MSRFLLFLFERLRRFAKHQYDNGKPYLGMWTTRKRLGVYWNHSSNNSNDYWVLIGAVTIWFSNDAVEVRIVPPCIDM